MFHFSSSLFHKALSVLGWKWHELCLNGVSDKREAQHFQRKALSLRGLLLSDLIMFCDCTSQWGFSTASKNVYLACDKSRSRVINMRKPSSLKKRLFPLERIPHFRDGFPPLINKNRSDSSWPEKSGKGDLPMTPKIVIFFFKGIWLSALGSFEIQSHDHWSHIFWEKRSLQQFSLFELFNFGCII